jgi:ribose transport system permease protein
VLLCIAGTLLNGDFATVDNAMNVLTRTAFIGIIAVGMCFVIISGGIDLSVGSMAALIAGSVILFMNWAAPSSGSPLLAVVLGMLLAVVLGAAVRPGARPADHQGPHRALHRDAGHARHLPRLPHLLLNGGAITLDNELSDLYSPVYYGSLLGIRCRCGCS